MEGHGSPVASSISEINIRLNRTTWLRWWCSRSKDEYRLSFCISLPRLCIRTSNQTMSVTDQATLGICRHKWHIQIALYIGDFSLQDRNRLKIGTDEVYRSKPPRFGKNRSLLKLNNLALYQSAKCCLICLKKTQQNNAFPYVPLSSTGYQENL